MRLRVVVITVVATVAVILGVRFAPDWYRNWQDARAQGVSARQEKMTEVWLRANGVVARPWATTKYPNETQLAGCPNGDLVGLSWTAKGRLSTYRNGKVVRVRHLTDPTNPKHEFVGLACSRSGAVYTQSFVGGFIVRVPSDGNPDLRWATITQKRPVLGGLAVTSDGAILVVDGDRSRILRVSPNGSVNWNWAKVGDGATGITIAPNQTVYVDYRRSTEITKITAGGIVTRRWATLPTELPRSAPAWLRSDGGLCSGFPNVDLLGSNIATDGKGDVFVGHTCLWRITPTRNISLWPMSTPDPTRGVFVYALGSGADGSIYGATQDGIVRFAIPTAR